MNRGDTDSFTLNTRLHIIMLCEYYYYYLGVDDQPIQ